jgi:hypothetical protein
MSVSPRVPSHLRAVGLGLVSALVALGLGGCGDATDDRSSSSTAPGSAAAGDGEWLLRFTTAGGADGEKVRAVYVRYSPATGAAAARALPAVTASDASPDEETLLVSADHSRAIQDTGVPKAQARSGKLVLYSVNSDATEELDIRAVTGKAGLDAVGWAFDPTAADILRVVDSDRVVWKVDLGAGTALQESTLEVPEGWIFGNGFDRNTGQPYVESIDSDETDPPGNGDSDTHPVERQGGTPFRYDGSALDGLPPPPCQFAGGFRFDDGTAWLFCADTPSITAYALAKGATGWTQDGAPSTDVVPNAAVELSFALPPVH